MNINRTIISGRLTKDPELKKIGEIDLCTFRIASNRIVGKKKVEKTIFIDTDAWGAQATNCNKFLKKGSRVVIEGILCQDTWDGKNGEKNSKVYIEADNVVFLDSNSDSQTSGEAKSESTQTQVPTKRVESQPAKSIQKPAPANKPVEEDGDLPF